MEPIRTAARILPHAAGRLQGRLSRAARDTSQMSDNQPATDLGDASASGEGIVQDGTKMPLATDLDVVTSTDEAQAR